MSCFDLFLHPKLKRWASNWTRLVLRVYGMDCLSWARRDTYRQRWANHPGLFVQMDFDSTLGYPGEGPPRRPPRRYLGLDFSCCVPWLRWTLPRVCLGVLALTCFGLLAPSGSTVFCCWSCLSSLPLVLSVCLAVSRFCCSCCMAPWRCLFCLQLLVK